MKQLLLYYLFFVGSGIILIQCGKTFPTENDSSKHQSGYQKKIDGSIYNKQHNEASNKTNAIAFKPGFENRVITPFFNNQDLTDNVMVNINYRALFNNSYKNLNYYDLIRKYHRKSQNDK